MKKHLLLLVLLIASTMMAWAQDTIDGISGTGTKDDPYLIENYENWKKAAELNKEGENFQGKYLKATGDFTTDLSFDKTFSGTFDGDGHTINSTIDDNHSDFTALFRHVDGATISNLHLTSDDMKVGKHGAALVASCDGNLTLENIRVSTKISFKANGNVYGGGVIGHAMNATLQLNGVVFDGKMEGTWGHGREVIGGIIGWGDNYTATMNDVLFCGTYEGDTPFTPIAGKYERATVKIRASHTLYTQAGKNVGDAQIADKGNEATLANTTDELGARITDYGLLQAYERGIKVADKLYLTTGLWGHGTQQSPYLIASADHWKLFYDSRHIKDNYDKQYIKMTDDFSTELMYDDFFRGSFDGGGHTITFNYKFEYDAGLFRRTIDASISHLKLAGRVETGVYGGALVGGFGGSSLDLTDIVVSADVHIVSPDQYELHGGGVIGNVNDGKINLTGVVYCGNISYPEFSDYDDNNIIGGIIGWGSNYTATLTDVFFCGGIARYYNSGFTHIAAKTAGSNPTIQTTHVYTSNETDRIFRCESEVAIWNTKLIKKRNRVEKVGQVTTDYGIVKIHDNGVSFDGQYYGHEVKLFGQGTQDDPILIEEDLEWRLLTSINGSGNTFAGKYIKLCNDLTTATGLNHFCGIFDGGGHTLATYCHVTFNHVSNATIRNLRLGGHEVSARTHQGGLINTCGGTVTLENVVVVRDVGRVMGETFIGGIIGNAQNATLNLRGVVYDGLLHQEFFSSLLDKDAQYAISGIIGWGENYTVNMTDVLFCGRYEDNKIFVPIATKRDVATVKATASNVLFTIDSKNANQKNIAVWGHQASTESSAQSLGKLVTDYGLLQAYEGGIAYNGKFYLGSKFSTSVLDEAPTIDDASAPWYTLDGRQLPTKPTTPGLYIHNGKKHVLK